MRGGGGPSDGLPPAWPGGQLHPPFSPCWALPDPANCGLKLVAPLDVYMMISHGDNNCMPCCTWGQTLDGNILGIHQLRSVRRRRPGLVKLYNLVMRISV